MVLKVFAENIIENNGIQRISDAIKRYAPFEIEFVENEKQADLVIIYAYGQRRKVEKRIKWIGDRGQKFAMVQIAIRSTANPDTKDWSPFWEKAICVWSYYDLEQLLREDKVETKFIFYHAPLGVEASVFKETNLKRSIKVVVGDNRDESVRECIKAAKGSVFNLGAGISDPELARVYSRSEFVSGLRRKEGFEMPVLEGLLCGARPICYDKPHYVGWFGDLVEYIPEGTHAETVKALEKIFNSKRRTVTDKEKQTVRQLFYWRNIIRGFWENIL